LFLSRNDCHGDPLPGGACDKERRRSSIHKFRQADWGNLRLRRTRSTAGESLNLRLKNTHADEYIDLTMMALTSAFAGNSIDLRSFIPIQKRFNTPI
jgi:hypothetical protein